MLQQERFVRIAEYLRTHQTASLSDISVLNNVSMDTTRRDFQKLEELGMLKRVRGGAIYLQADVPAGGIPPQIVAEQSILPSHSEELSSFISEGQTVAVGGGFESEAIAKFLVGQYERLIILTNSLSALEIFAAARKFTTIVPSGTFYPTEQIILGPSCEKDILQYNVDVALLPVQAVSLQAGISDSLPDRIHATKAFMAVSQDIIFVSSHTKFGQEYPLNVCQTRDIQMLLSDQALPEETRHAFKKQGITLLTPFSP